MTQASKDSTSADSDGWVYGFLENVCPKCGQQVGQPCRSLSSGRSTDTHAARRTAWFERRITSPAEGRSA